MKQYLMELFASAGYLEPEVIVIRLGVSAVIACCIYLSYRLSHVGTIYSRKFNVTLAALAVITTTVMIVIGNNIALSLGMVGALSIVRFRTAIKDSRDTAYIFWAIVVGICCGAGDFWVAGIGSAFTFVVFLVLGYVRNDNRILLIIRAGRVSESKVEALIFQRFARKAVLRAKNTTESSVEFIFELSRRLMEKDRKTAKGLTDEVYALGGIEYFNIVMQNDDISS